MSFEKEDWKPSETILKGHNITNMFTKPSLGFKEKMKEVTPFVDYHANEELPCVTYERATIACINQFGLFTPAFNSQKNCLTAAKWYDTCVKNYNTTYLAKKYFPERRIDTSAYQPVLHIDELL